MATHHLVETNIGRKRLPKSRKRIAAAYIQKGTQKVFSETTIPWLNSEQDGFKIELK